ncbi:MAG: enoyl-CoA hydratase/isomerase family protein [Pusillimonas sp.]
MSVSNERNILRIDHKEAPGAVTIQFNRPAVRNALAPEDLLLVNQHLLECQYDDAVKVIFLTGAGSAFCAGFDLKVLNALPAGKRASALDTATELMIRIVSSPKIIISAVNGASAGLGNHIALCSDLCIAVHDANFHFTGASKGIPSMQFGALLLPMTVGLKRAKALLLRGGKVSATKAEEIGMCNAVIEPERWKEEIASLADEFCTRNPTTLSQNKFQANQLALQMIGALKLSSIAGGSQMALADQFVTGRIGDSGAQS